MFRLNRNKQETNRYSLIGSIFCYFLQKMQGFSGFFGFFSVCFKTVLFGCFASIPKQRVSIEPKQTEYPPKQFKREYIWKFFQNFGLFRFVSVCYETDLFVSLVQIQVRNTETNQNFFFLVSRNKPKQTETNAKQILFRFVSITTENYFCLFRGHPSFVALRHLHYQPTPPVVALVAFTGRPTGRQPPPLSSVLYGIIYKRYSVVAAEVLLREKSGAQRVGPDSIIPSLPVTQCNSYGGS